MSTGRTAVVVGGSRGIGRAISGLLAETHSTVAVIYRSDEQAAAETAGLVEARGARALPVRADMRDAPAIAAALEELAQRTGSLDTFVHTAGALTDWKVLRDMSPQGWRDHIDSDLNGFFNAVSPALRIMHAQGSGNIVAITSISPRAAAPHSAQSAASKAGVEAMIRVIAREEGRHGIRANAVAPGLTETDQGRQAMEHWGPEGTKRVLAQSAIPRMGTAEEVAQVVAFLVSPAASYVTGRVIIADGGQFLSA